MAPPELSEVEVLLLHTKVVKRTPVLGLKIFQLAHHPRVEDDQPLVDILPLLHRPKVFHLDHVGLEVLLNRGQALRLTSQRMRMGGAIQFSVLLHRLSVETIESSVFVQDFPLLPDFK